MMVPKFVELWVADAEGTALGGPFLGEMLFRDEHVATKDVGMNFAVAPVRHEEVLVPEGHAFPLMIQAYDLDDDETLLGWWPVWMTFPKGCSLSLSPWPKQAGRR